jgi:hypothetical protein
MKKLLIIVLSGYMLASCSLFSNQKLGCKTNGKNIGAERVLSGDKQTMKALKRANKFKD